MRIRRCPLRTEQRNGVAIDGEDPPIELRVRVYRRSGEFSVTPARFPRRAKKTNAKKRSFDDSNARQKRMRVWHLVADRGLTMVTSFDRVQMGKRTLTLAGRRLRDRHGRRFENDCDYVLIADGRQPATVHAFTVPYPVEDQDVVTDLFPLVGADPEVRMLTQRDELKDTVYDACAVFKRRKLPWDVHVMCRTGPLDMVEELVTTVDEGIEVVQSVVAPDAVRVDFQQRFGSRPRAYGRFRPTVHTPTTELGA